MGHQITSTDSTFSVREMPWMGLLNGEVKVLDEYPTREEAQQIVHPWDPVEQPVFRRVIEMTDEGPVSSFEEIAGEKELVRSDNGDHLSVVASTRGTVTNSEMWDVAEEVAKAEGVRYETAGSLDGGKRVWILMRLDEPLQIKGDPNGGTLAFFAIQGGHSRDSGAWRGQAGNTRIVCANTSAAMDVESSRSGHVFNFRHSAKVGERIEEAKAAVGLWREQIAIWQTAMEHLLTVSVSEEQRELFVQEFQPMPPERLITERVRSNVERARAQMREILAGPTCEGVDLTAYGLAQAGIEWNQHYRRTKGSSERARMESHFKRAMLSTDRIGYDIVQLALEVAH